MINDLVWFCDSYFDVDETLVGYKSLTTPESIGISVDVVEIIGYWDVACDWIGDMGLAVFDEVLVEMIVGLRIGCDGDVFGDEDPKM